MNQYPGVFFIDAHQQGERATSSRPTRTRSTTRSATFSLDFIQNDIGPALQRRVQRPERLTYRNYNQYDLFTPEYGDTVPSLLMGAAGMTYEKGTSEIYGKQVYDHYLAIDTTINVTVERQGQRPHGLGRAVGRGDRAGRGLPAAARTRSSARCTTRSSSSPTGQRLRLLLQARPAHGRHGGADRPAAEDRRARLQARHAGGRQRLPRVRQRHGRRRRSTATADAARRDPVDPDGPGHEALDPGPPGREPVHPVRLLLRRRHLVVPAPARPRGLRLPDPADVAGHPDDRDHIGPQLGTAPAAARRSTRSTPTRRAASASRSTCSTRASTSTARRSRSRPAASSSTPAPRSSTARRWPASGVDLAAPGRPSATRRSPAWRATRSPRHQLSDAEDRPLHGRGDDPVEPAVNRVRTSAATRHCGARPAAATSFCEALHDLGRQGRASRCRPAASPVTSADLASGRAGQRAASPRSSTRARRSHDDGPAPPCRRSRRPARALQKFINGGGIYIGNDAGGASAARSLRADRR